MYQPQVLREISMKIGNILAIILMSVGLASVAQASGDGAAGEKIVTGV